MPLAVTDALWAALTVLAFLVVAALAVALAVGVPVGVGKLIYDRAETENLTNPAALGFGAAFFAALIGVFAIGVALLYYG